METTLTLKYNRETDVLYIDTRPPYAGQTSRRLGEQVVVRLNPTNGVIENLEIPLFFTRLLERDSIELPLAIDFRWSRNP